MANIDIYYTKIQPEWIKTIYSRHLERLPNDLKQKNIKFRRWQDRLTNLFGKLLLVKGLTKYGFSDSVLKNLKYTAYDKPYLEGAIDFNISHSGEYVMCAITKKGRLGIDIEEQKEVQFNDFEDIMSEEQWNIIRGSTNPKSTFFQFWTMKESVIKAEGQGLSIPLKDIVISDNRASYNSNLWYINLLNIDNKYASCLATNFCKPTINYYETFFD